MDKTLRIYGIGRMSSGSDFPSFPLNLDKGGQYRFAIFEQELERLHLSPADFLKKYFELRLQLESGEEGPLYLFDLNSSLNKRFGVNDYQPTITKRTHLLELRKDRKKIEGVERLKMNLTRDMWLGLTLTQEEYEEVNLLHPQARFNVESYKIVETEPPVIQDVNGLAFRDLLRSKEFERCQGYYVAIFDGVIMDYSDDPVDLERRMDFRSTGELYIARVVRDDSPMRV